MKLLGRLILIVLSSYLSLLACRYIVETYFFDRVVYYKSVEHGYWIPYKKLSWSDFGKRGSDIDALLGPNKTKNSGSYSTKSVTEKEPFTIALIGDSYVWGQGVRYEQTFASILTNKLDDIRPVKILKLGIPGNDIINHLWMYNVTKNRYPKVDLYIFALGRNDILLTTRRYYDQQFFDTTVHECLEKHGAVVTDIENMSEGTGSVGYESLYLHRLEQAYTNQANFCVYRIVFSQLPKTNAIYFLTDEYEVSMQDTGYYLLRNELERNNLHTVSSVMGKNMKKYAKFWNTPQKYFEISKIEQHPSPLAHAMYADILFQEIVRGHFYK